MSMEPSSWFAFFSLSTHRSMVTLSNVQSSHRQRGRLFGCLLRCWCASSALRTRSLLAACGRSIWCWRQFNLWQAGSQVVVADNIKGLTRRVGWGLTCSCWRTFLTAALEAYEVQQYALIGCIHSVINIADMFCFIFSFQCGIACCCLTDN